MISKEKIVATIEARYASTRLPGKTLLEICGKPTLELIIERLKQSKFIEEIVVATTVNPDCDAIEKLALKLNVGCYRGSEEDVLDRVLKAGKAYNANIIVEITGDETLIDSIIIDETIEFYLKNNYDYVSNILDRRYPRGLDTQVFSLKVLDKVSRLTNEPADRENVSLYIYEHPEMFKLGSVRAPEELNHPEWRWTLDTKEDFQFLKTVYSALYPNKKNFNSYDVLKFLKDNPQVVEINKSIKQKAVR
ncbi:acylneuraminate cytidylyltransferase [Candidatus Omnitrophus magneticus]|uniref:Acylneuraminate cytidylyltransferase n=1 Tax=Candidatus Omnitrophus magneticus TaxID=1609969 RepID=A0A0F0CVM1_9BACT|nr:acylneuraminate cytidylyltransferase [Candidatus Omnitrophus magneticus]